MLFESIGILRYTPEPKYKLIVEVDHGIVDYYRCFVPKSIRLNKQMYAPHISVVRKELPPNLALWGRYEGESVTFQYDNTVHIGSVYTWLNVYSKRLEAIREELGLPRHSSITLPPEGFNWSFHVTIGNQKQLT